MQQVGSRRKQGRRARLTAASVVVWTIAAIAPAVGSAQDPALQRLGPNASVERHDETGKLRFVGTQPGRPIPAAAGVSPTTADEDAARAFVGANAADFGIRDASTDLRRSAAVDAGGGNSSVRFQQLHRGIDVFGGELIVNLDEKNNVLSASGELTPSPDLAVKPRISVDDAVRAAVAKTAKVHRVAASKLEPAKPQLSVYDNRLLGAPGLDKAQLVYRTEVTADGIREIVLVEAGTGKIALNFNQIAEAKNRRTCDAANTESNYPCTSPVRVEGGPSHPVADVNQAHDYAGDTYDFFRTRFGRDSLDGAGMPLTSTVRWCPAADCPAYQNAFWDGTQMVYGNGFTSADDVVGHELAHGVTEFTSHLFYYYQSGAINESMSDVFGELIDLVNAKGNDTAAVRWQLGEDLPASVGVIRDMEDPTVFGDPDRMQSPNYWTDEGDQGGVHINSGVNNKAAYLMTDGATFNGITVTGLGIDKVARIYYLAETTQLTSGSDFQDLHNALKQACNNLVGTYAVTAANCLEVGDAVTATEMHLQPTVAAPPQAPACGAGQFPRFSFNDNLETPAAGKWTKAGTFYYPQNTHPYTGQDFTYATSGKYNIWGDNVDVTGVSSMTQTTAVVIPANTFMTFQHAYDFEAGAYDGGVLEYSANGGAFVGAEALFTNGAYNGTISSSFGNPLGGRRAFIDRSFGYGASRLNLASLAGMSVKFRFRLGTDSSVGDWGWFIDDIKMFTCSADTTAPVVTAPVQSLTANSTLGTSPTAPSIPTTLTWSATDDRSLSITYELQRSINGAAFVSITGQAQARSKLETLTPGTGYQYRVLARDEAGNIGTGTGPAFTPGVVQEDSTAIAYSAGWLTRLAQSTAYGGFVRPTTTVGAKASHTIAAGARNLAVIMPKAATLGTTQICLFQGASATALICSTIDVSPTVGLGPRMAVFVRNALLTTSSHRVEVTDSSGRVELDAIVTTR